MRTSLKFGLIFAIFCLKVETIYTTGNLFTTDQNNVYYIDDEQKYSWFDALTQCAMLKMNLVSIETEEKSNEITNLLKKQLKHVNPLWIGAIANGNDRHYVWISNGHTVTFTNWYQGEPDFHNNNEYCLQTGWSDKLQWNDHECHKTYGLICEYKHNDLEMENKLTKSETKGNELQEELKKKQEKLQEEFDKELQLRNEFDSNQDNIHEVLFKQQQLQEDLYRTQLLLQWFLGNKRPYTGNNEGNKSSSEIFVNIN